MPWGGGKHRASTNPHAHSAPTAVALVLGIVATAIAVATAVAIAVATAVVTAVAVALGPVGNALATAVLGTVATAVAAALGTPDTNRQLSQRPLQQPREGVPRHRGRGRRRCRRAPLL